MSVNDDLLPCQYILSDTPKLAALIAELALVEVNKPLESQEYMIENETGYFKIRTNGGYLISSYYSNRSCSSRTINIDKMDDFIAATHELYQEYLYHQELGVDVSAH